MHKGRDLLREFWKAGVRVRHGGDRFRLQPPGVAPEELRKTLGRYTREVSDVLAELPAGGRCPICGASNGWPLILELHCVTCALIYAERRYGRDFVYGNPVRVISPKDTLPSLSGMSPEQNPNERTA